ncbi:hypothetical protein [Comamonas terrae]|uniref:Fe-S oxidoreductase n=1 Tax=Comamonas terrae TaxID=673548 RepID=A0ABW5UJL9_9BURK|nr:hypothetical protein [Comamonas terrae]
MSTPIAPATALPAGLGNVPDPAAPAAATPVAGTVPPAAAVPAPASAPAAMPAATSVQWSAQALQELRLQAFEQLIAQLALQIQAPGQPLAPAWPAQGLSAPLQQWLQVMLQQIAVQGQPLQLLAAQPGSAALIQALAQAQTQAAAQQGSESGDAAQASALRMAAALSPTLAAALQAAAAPSSCAAAPTAPAMPPLQNWWVQQGTLLTPQGERGFSLTLQVPPAWALSMGAATPADSAPQAAATAPALRLPWPEGTPLPASGPMALVLQPQDHPAGARTSALLWLEFQSAPVGATSANIATPMAPGNAGLPLFAPAPALAQEVQQLLQNKSDPWLMMAAAQAANAVPGERRPLGEHRTHLCTTEGCQYQGRAPCAQPFCSEMNRVWAAARLEKS